MHALIFLDPPTTSPGCSLLVQVVEPYDIDADIEVLDPESRLCRLAASDKAAAYGLPHVLRLVSRDGAFR